MLDTAVIDRFNYRLEAAPKGEGERKEPEDAENSSPVQDPPAVP
jgi:hypothetical protein